MIRSVLGRVLGALLLTVCALVGVQGDIGYYENTNAESVTDENLSNHPNPVADVALRTSNSYLAGTTDTVYATFIGDFSSSGPHALGSFTQGEKSDIVVTLDRVIGELKKVLMHKDGIDGYLLSNMQVRMRDKIYELSGPRQWLDNLDVDTEALYPASGGYEPDVQESSDEVPAASALELTVEGYINYYSETGIYTGW